VGWSVVRDPGPEPEPASDTYTSPSRILHIHGGMQSQIGSNGSCNPRVMSTALHSRRVRGSVAVEETTTRSGSRAHRASGSGPRCQERHSRSGTAGGSSRPHSAVVIGRIRPTGRAVRKRAEAIQGSPVPEVVARRTRTVPAAPRAARPAPRTRGEGKRAEAAGEQISGEAAVAEKGTCAGCREVRRAELTGQALSRALENDGDPSPASRCTRGRASASYAPVLSSYAPVVPSIRSRTRSAWPLCRAYSSIMCTRIHRREMLEPPT
jgi:hypothetical protein